MENWNHAKEIFYLALHKLPAEREIFLAEVCGDDSQLLSDVKMLIDSYKSEFLEQPILDFHTDSLPEIPNDSQFQTGDIINHYTILRMLGRGGMGEVYLARDKKLDRLVAIKILHQGAGEKAEKRLLREARAVAKLEHPNICSVYEVGETDQFPFIVMQFVEGETLDKLIKSNSISAVESIEFTRQIAKALDEAHTHNIIHRDIKPSNIIIDQKKQVKVLDFSLAKKALVETGADTESMLSELGVVAGTVAYMSPEQARGQEIDARSDIWSLGVVLFEMLTGKLPFSGDSKSDIIAAILTKDPLKLTRLNANFPPEYDEIISKLLQKSRDKRYRSINEFSDALSKLHNVRQDFNQLHSVGRNESLPLKSSQTNLVSNDSAQHSTVSELTKLPDESARNSNKSVVKSKFSWKWFVPAFLTVSVFLGVTYWGFYANSAPKFETFTADSRSRLQISTLFSTKRKPNGEITSLSFSPDGKLITFLLVGEGITDVYVKQIDQGEPIKITDGKYTIKSPIWSFDSQKIAFLSNRDNKNAIWTISYLGGTPILQKSIETPNDFVTLVKWGNDGKKVYFSTNGKLKTIDIESGQVSDIKLPEADIYGSFSVSNDEKMITFVVIEDKKEKIWCQSLENGEIIKLFNNEFSNWAPVFFPNNSRIAYSSNQNGNYQIYVSNLQGSEVSQITFGDANANIPAISPDGSKIVFVSEKDEANIYSLDLASKKETALTENTKMQLFPNISPNEDKLLFQVTDDIANFLASSIKIKELNIEKEPSSIVNYGGLGKWSPQGDKIAFLKYAGFFPTLWVIDVASQKEKQLTTEGILMERYTISPFNFSSIPFNWSKDGSKIAFSSYSSNFMNIWTVNVDTPLPQMVTNNSEKTTKFSSPIWSDDGNKIAFLSKKTDSDGKFIFEVMILNNSTSSIFQSKSELRLLGWAENDSKLYVAKNERTTVDIYEISISNPAKSKVIASLKDAQFESVKISPDFTKVVFSARRNSIDNIYLLPFTGREFQLTSNLENTLFYSGISWSPNGDKLYFSKQTGGLQISTILNQK